MEPARGYFIYYDTDDCEFRRQLIGFHWTLVGAQEMLRNHLQTMENQLAQDRFLIQNNLVHWFYGKHEYANGWFCILSAPAGQLSAGFPGEMDMQLESPISTDIPRI